MALYRRRERSRHARLKKVAFLGGGVLAVAAGIVTYPVPLVPSELVILFGIASIAQASKPGARLLDWLELKLRPAFRPLYRLWKRLPQWLRLALIAAWTIGLAYLGFVVYRRLRG